MNKIRSIVVFLSVLSLAIELPLFQISGNGIKLWIPAAALGGLFLLWDIFQKGFGWLKQSKLLWLGLGLVFFSLLGIINSPLKSFSIKQLVILVAIIVLGVFFELNLKKYRRETYSGLFAGILINSFYAIYQNVAFNLGWPNFEVMAARPNGFFPEPDWMGIYLALGLVPFLVWVAKDLAKSPLPERMRNKFIFYPVLIIALTALIITVARASWLALIAEMGVIIAVSLFATVVIPAKARWKQSFKNVGVFISLILTSLILINLFHLSRFNIPDRFRSIFFKEHIVTEAYSPATGEKFKINLEDIETYRNQGYLIQENYIGDENVASREEKFTSAWDTIKAHPLLGSGLGITLINTNYEHNANNLFLEWWASAGLGALLLTVGLLLYLLGRGLLLLETKPIEAALVLAGTTGFIIVNLFNASIFLAFAWFYLACQLTELQSHKVIKLKG